MADPIAAVRTFFLGKSAITDLVGQRIYPGHLPEAIDDAAIVLIEVSASSEAHLLGLSGLGQSRIRVQCYAAKRTDAVSIREAVRTSGLCNFGGLAGGVYFCGATIESRGQGADPPADGSDAWRWFEFVDFMVNYEETTT